MKIHFVLLALATITSAWAGPISCTPTTLKRGDKLTIQLAQAFPDIAVITPKKLGGINFFMLNETGSSGLIQSDQLMKQRSAVIDVNSATLDGQSKLFFTSGTYEFVVSKNLETDDGTPVYKCKVKFVDTTTR